MILATSFNSFKLEEFFYFILFWPPSVCVCMCVWEQQENLFAMLTETFICVVSMENLNTL